MREIKKISAFIHLSFPVLLPVCFGYSVVVLSFYFGFLPASSGAVLVGTCIIAELQFNRLEWRQTAQYFGYKTAEPYDNKDGSRWLKASDGSFFMPDCPKEFDTLKTLDNTVRANTEFWKPWVALKGFDVIVTWIIGLSALFGTMVWGYTDWILEKLA